MASLVTTTTATETETSTVETTNQGETKEPILDNNDGGDDEIETDPKYKTSEKVSIKELMNKDADDKALQKYKESLLGTGGNGTSGEPVTIIELRMLFEGRDPLVIPLSQKGTRAKEVVILKENEPYTCQVVFQVNNEIVSGLQLLRIVTRSGIRVDKDQIMIGSYAPSTNPIVSFLSCVFSSCSCSCSSSLQTASLQITLTCSCISFFFISTLSKGI
jgi:hypothetical protein